jgi:alpha-tubulin suppressor-like RCC1 family protein
LQREESTSQILQVSCGGN